ncbi:hypothetical protein WA026_007534 [Henosepilachna vigintioctopunctata]|uniref:FLYWCH-type domain-containing protein n=1 Tax=Henosepilachna vigintioctopunctata TaxID=420089 RepID=A0AAW1UNI0_9CUCU
MPGTKHPKIVLDNFLFTINQKKKDRTMWICSKYPRTNCKARLVTFGRNVKMTRGHNHDPVISDDMTKDMIVQKAHIIRCDKTFTEDYIAEK